MCDLDAEALSQSLGIRVFDIQQEPVTSGSCHSRIYACRSEIGDLILRICKGEQGFYTQYFPGLVDPNAWMDQHWAIEKARSVGVPTPEIVLSNRQQRWIVMRRLPGVAIESEYELWDRCPYDEKEFGVLLSRLHVVEPSGYGPIDDEGRTIFPTWQDFLVQAALSALRTCVDRGAMPSALAARMEQHWLPELQRTGLDRSSLLHMESLGFANIMYDPETRAITGLLDYEDCIGGDPLFEVCWMKYYFEHDSPDQRYFDLSRFAEGYGRLNLHSQRLKLYRPFPFLDKLRWIETDSSRARRYVQELEAFAT